MGVGVGGCEKGGMTAGKNGGEATGKALFGGGKAVPYCPNSNSSVFTDIFWS